MSSGPKRTPADPCRRPRQPAPLRDLVRARPGRENAGGLAREGVDRRPRLRRARLLPGHAPSRSRAGWGGGACLPGVPGRERRSVQVRHDRAGSRRPGPRGARAWGRRGDRHDDLVPGLAPPGRRPAHGRARRAAGRESSPGCRPGSRPGRVSDPPPPRLSARRRGDPGLHGSAFRTSTDRGPAASSVRPTPAGSPTPPGRSTPTTATRSAPGTRRSPAGWWPASHRSGARSWR